MLFFDTTSFSITYIKILYCSSAQHLLWSATMSLLYTVMAGLATSCPTPTMMVEYKHSCDPGNRPIQMHHFPGYSDGSTGGLKESKSEASLGYTV